MSAAGEHWLTRRALAGDTEAAAAFWILTDPIFARDGRVWAHVDDRTEGIDFAAIIDEGTWSSGERVLVQLAANLWSGSGAVDMARICGLSEGFFRVALTALEARRSTHASLPFTVRQRADLKLPPLCSNCGAEPAQADDEECTGCAAERDAPAEPWQVTTPAEVYDR